MVHLRVKAAGQVICLLGSGRRGGRQRGRGLGPRAAAVLLLLQLLRNLGVVLLLQ